MCHLLNLKKKLVQHILLILLVIKVIIDWKWRKFNNLFKKRKKKNIKYIKFNQFFIYCIHNKKRRSPKMTVKVEGARYETEIWKTQWKYEYTMPLGWGFHGKSFFFFNMLWGDLHFDVLILALCLIFLIIDRTLGKGKVPVGVSMETWTISLTWGKGITWRRNLPVGLGVGEHFAWYLVIAIVFMLFEGTKRWVEET